MIPDLGPGIFFYNMVALLFLFFIVFIVFVFIVFVFIVFVFIVYVDSHPHVDRSNDRIQ